MKKLIIASVIVALSGMGLAPQNAQAGNNEAWAAIGGFIGGVIVGSALDEDQNSSVVINASYGHNHRRGYWEVVAVRTWVPGYWVVKYDDCGRRYRHFNRGYYTTTKQRVWVDGRGNRHYGYNHDQDRGNHRGRDDRRDRRG